MAAMPANPVPTISPAEMQILVSRAGLVLNPGQVADLVLAWRQLAGLIASLPHDRKPADDAAYSFRLPPPAAAAPARAEPAQRSPAAKAVTKRAARPKRAAAAKRAGAKRAVAAKSRAAAKPKPRAAARKARAGAAAKPRTPAGKPRGGAKRRR